MEEVSWEPVMRVMLGRDGRDILRARDDLICALVLGLGGGKVAGACESDLYQWVWNDG